MITNLLDMLRGVLISGDTLRRGEVIDTHANGTVTVRLAHGGYLQPRGEGPVGRNVYIRGGQVIGDAPALDYYELEV